MLSWARCHHIIPYLALQSHMYFENIPQNCSETRRDNNLSENSRT